jgi:hypothetical protein
MAAAQQPRMQAPQQQPHMANGGVAHLPVPETMYNFKNGGIIGFKTGDSVPDISSRGLMAQAAQGAANFTGAEPVDPDVIKAQYIAAHPEQAGILARPVAETMSKGLAEQEARDKAEYEKQTGAESKKRDQIAFSNALLNAAEQTRGTKGIGGLGPALAGYGGSYNAAQEKEMERLANLAKTKREQDMLTLKYKSEVEAAQRAAADNDYTKHLAYLNAAAQTKAEAAKLGIDVAAKLAGVAGQLESANIMASKSHAVPESIQIADRLMKESGGKLSFAKALQQISENKGYGREIETILKERDKVDSDPAIKIGMMSPIGSKQRLAAEAERDKRYKAIDAYYGRASSEPTETPTTPGSSLMPQPAGQWKNYQEVKP